MNPESHPAHRPKEYLRHFQDFLIVTSRAMFRRYEVSCWPNPPTPFWRAELDKDAEENIAAGCRYIEWLGNQGLLLVGQNLGPLQGLKFDPGQKYYGGQFTTSISDLTDLTDQQIAKLNIMTIQGYQLPDPSSQNSYL